MRAIRFLVRHAAIILLAFKAVWIGLTLYGVYVADYWYISELQAHSVIFCAVLAYNAYIGRACLYVWVSIFTLLGLNALNIVYYFFNFSYLLYYSGALVAAGLTFALIDAIRETRNNNARPKLYRS